jgi:N-acylneuraminate cytidylyltransferase
MSVPLIYAIIPARGGSKGVPRKNLQAFLGKPLLTHSIEYALAAESVSRVFVSTEDAEIADVARNAGSEVLERPHALAGDTATTESAIQHALDHWHTFGEDPDIVVLLQATSPLRPRGSLDAALSTFRNGGYDSLLSISPTHRFFWKVKGTETIAEYDYLNRPRRQELTPEDIRYVENGSVYIFSREHFSKTANRLGGKIGHVVFPEEFSLEIDTLADFTILETLAKELEY